jgi:Cu(I)/Ag(I) efflux system membrane fusion protein
MANENTPVESTDAVKIITPEPELTGRQKFRLVGLVILKRVRFFAILAGVGLFIGYWDTVKSHWDRWTHPRATANRELPPGEEFYCSMDPQVIRTTYEPNGDVPGCPICGMPLTIRAKGQKEELPAGITGRVRLSPERVQMAGIKTVAVGYRPMARQTRTVGYVTYDESGLSRIVSRVDGYVEKLYVDKNYAIVHKGDPLAEIYSPDLYSTARELALAARGQGVDQIAASARNKLLLLGVWQQDIDRIEASGEASKWLVIRSPQTGQVVEKKIVVGASVDAKMTLFEVADLSTVWIEAEVYEKDIAFLQPGQKVEATLEAYPNRTFVGELASIYPRVEAATRTNRIRVRLENPRNELRPGMYADVTIDTPLETIEPYKTLAAKTHGSPLPPGEGQGVRAVTIGSNGSSMDKSPSLRPSPILSQATGGRAGSGAARLRQEFLVVPEQAVVDTGAKKIIYVQREEGLFEGVEVELGPRQDDFYPVLKGLAAGDKVAAAGGFLVDAETRLNPAAASTYFGASGGPQSGSGSPPPVTQKPSRDRVAEAVPRSAVVPCEDDIKNIDQLPEEDRQPARAQAMCPVTEAALGSMGVPVKITLRGKPVYLCCKGCIGKAKRDPDGTLKKLESRYASPHPNPLPKGEGT